MAKVPLRLYNREIENLIDHKQTEEAAAHCRHVLQIFPKHIDTYRLLGKAYLEAQKYGEAVDIFQRVISVIPDDFVSHVGMSIIREDEGNLDAAIWHMERAFEVAPSNNAVQEELRRLYGRRDGIEPPKVRLTRGALVRMYAKGDLYGQAISEILSTLAEEPDRADMQVMLARMYLADGKRIEATEICSSLLVKFPFCWEANLILAEILPSTSRSEDTQIYQQRLNAMDPYMAYISPIYSSPSEVPDNLILVDRLEWEPSQAAAPAQPAWAESLGIKIEENFPLDLPDWLNPTPQAQKFPSVDVDKPLGSLSESLSTPPVEEPDASGLLPQETAKEPAPMPESDIPDWMKDAGWLSNDMPSASPEALLPMVEENQPGEEVSDVLPADIPDWVKAMAPSEAVEPNPEGLAENVETPASEQAERASEDMPAWLHSIIDRPQETPPASFEAGSVSAEVPDWLRDLKEDSTPENTPPSGISQAEIPVVDETHAVPSEINDSEVMLPDEELVHDAEATQELPSQAGEPVEPLLASWLEEVDQSMIPSAKDTGELSGDSSEVFEPVIELIPTETFPVPGVAVFDRVEVQPDAQVENIPDEIKLPSWLDEYEEEPLEDQPPAVIPGWLDDIAVEGIEPNGEEGSSGVPAWFDEAAAASDLAGQVRDWQSEPPSLVEPKIQPELSTVSVEPASGVSAFMEETEHEQAEAASPAELPDWLLTLQNEEASAVKNELDTTGPEGTPESVSVFAIEEQTPAEVEADAIPPVSDEAAQTIRVASIRNPSDQKSASSSEEDTTTAWLEDLAAIHTSEAQTLIVRRGNREVQPPKWVSEQDQASSEPEEQPAPVQPFNPESESAALENWLRELESEQQAKDPDAFVNRREPVPKNTAALRMWLDNLLQDTPSEETQVAISGQPVEQNLPVSGKPDEWLHEHIQIEAEPQEAAGTLAELSQVSEGEESIPTGSVEAQAADEEPVTGVELSISEAQDVAEEFEASEEPLSPDVPPAVEGLVTTADTPALEELVTPEATHAPEEQPVEMTAQESGRLIILDEESTAEQISPSVEAQVETPAEVSGIETEESGLPFEESLIIGEMTPVEESEALAEELLEEQTPEKPAALEEKSEALAQESPEAITPSEVSSQEVEPQLQTPRTEEEITEYPEASADKLTIQAPGEPDLSETTSVEIEAELQSQELLAPEPEPVVPETTTPAAEDLIPDWLKGLVEEEDNAPAEIQSLDAELQPERGLISEIPIVAEEPSMPDFSVLEVSEPEAPQSDTTTSEAEIPAVAQPDTDLLEAAEKNLWAGEIDASLHQFSHLIKNEQHLDQIIKDLKDVLYQRPVDVSIWETLGDAYARQNCLQEALDAYTKAEELLR